MTKDDAALFEKKPEFIGELKGKSGNGRGIEIVTELTKKYTPTGRVAIFLSLSTLFVVCQKVHKEGTTFATRVRQVHVHLKWDGIVLDPILLSLFFLCSLGDEYTAVRQEFALNG